MDIFALIGIFSFILSSIFGGISYSLEDTVSREKVWKWSIQLFNLSIFALVFQMYQHLML